MKAIASPGLKAHNNKRKNLERTNLTDALIIGFEKQETCWWPGCYQVAYRRDRCRSHYERRLFAHWRMRIATKVLLLYGKVRRPRR